MGFAFGAGVKTKTSPNGSLEDHQEARGTTSEVCQKLKYETGHHDFLETVLSYFNVASLCDNHESQVCPYQKENFHKTSSFGT